MTTTENNVAAKAGDEPIYCPFCGKHGHAPDCYFTLQEIMLSGSASALSMVPDVIAAWNRRVSPRATADVERVMMDCLIALSIGYVQSNDAGDEVCPDCDVDHVGADHSPGCLVLRARAARAQLAAIATTKPGA